MRGSTGPCVKSTANVSSTSQSVSSSTKARSGQEMLLRGAGVPNGSTARATLCHFGTLALTRVNPPEGDHFRAPDLTEQEQQADSFFSALSRPDKAFAGQISLFAVRGQVLKVELVCNGKTSEVCNIVLPFQVIEQVDEPRL